MQRVTVMVPTFNRPEMLREALESLIAQTVPDWRAIVADNGGTSGSDTVVCGMDPRISYVWFPPGCSNRNGNRLLRMWEGGYGCALHDDDTLTSDSLEKRIAYLDEHADVDCVVTALNYWDGERPHAVRDRDPSVWTDDFASWYDQTNTPTLMFRSPNIVIPHNEACTTGIDDGVWQYEMFLRGVRFGYIPEPLYNYRMHAGQESSVETLAARREVVDRELAAISQRARDLRGLVHPSKSR